MQTTITFRDELTPLLQAATDLMGTPRPLLAAMGERLAVDLRSHFAQRERRPNRRGWPKRHLWADIQGSTALAEVTDEEARVVISDPRINQKVHGGRIVPKRGRALAIPVRAEAYAAGSPREWDGSEKLFRPKGRMFLAVRRAGKLVVMYRLVPHVDQRPDPEALPPRDALVAGILVTGSDTLLRALRRQSSST